jgi:hypothetical protein
MRDRFPHSRMPHLPQTRFRRIVPVALASLVALAVATAPSVAAPSGSNGPVSGIVIDITSERLQVQTASGPVTVAITDTTRVIRTVTGTVADLRKRQIVELDLDKKSGRVVAIHIAPPGTKLTKGNPGRGRGNGQAKNRGPAQILAVSRTTLRVRYANGRVVTYRLVKEPRVIKDVRGRIGDVAIGQTVRVIRSHAGRVANVIVIMRG